jgi:hypothetical protein
MSFKVDTKEVNGHIVYYESGKEHRWLDAIGPNVVKYIDDFITYSEDEWTETAVSAGTGTSDIDVDDAQNGILTADAAANENDGIQIQHVGEAWKLTTNDPLYFGVRWAITDTPQADMVIGLAVNSTTLIATNVNGVYIRTKDGETTVEGVTDATAQGETELLATIVASTYYVDEFYWDGVDTVYWWHDGTRIGTYSTAANIPTSDELKISIAYLNGAGSMQHSGINVDWLRCIQILASR